MYQECSNNCCKNDTLLEATPKMKNCVSTAPARADRGSDPLENHTKSKENETFEPTRQKVQQNGALWVTFGMILMAFGAITPQTRENTTLLRGQGPKHCRTHALEGGRCALGLRENNDLAFKCGFTTVLVTFRKGAGP